MTYHSGSSSVAATSPTATCARGSTACCDEWSVWIGAMELAGLEPATSWVRSRVAFDLTSPISREFLGDARLDGAANLSAIARDRRSFITLRARHDEIREPAG